MPESNGKNHGRQPKSFSCIVMSKGKDRKSNHGDKGGNQCHHKDCIRSFQSDNGEKQSISLTHQNGFIKVVFHKMNLGRDFHPDFLSEGFLRHRNGDSDMPNHVTLQVRPVRCK